MLIERLVERQRTLGLTDEQMAVALGIGRTNYSAIKTRRVGISLKVGRAIAKAFPDLTPVVLDDAAQPAVPA